MPYPVTVFRGIIKGEARAGAQATRDREGSQMRDIIMAEAPIAIGYDCDGNGKVSFYPLTPCCCASGKGSESETGVVCRSCYETVDSRYGGFWYADESKFMVAGYNIAGRWSDYTELLTSRGVGQEKAAELTAEAKRQAEFEAPGQFQARRDREGSQ